MYLNIYHLKNFIPYMYAFFEKSKCNNNNHVFINNNLIYILYTYFYNNNTMNKCDELFNKIIPLIYIKNYYYYLYIKI